MKKLAYIATMVCGLTLAGTSCVDLDQEPQSFITEEDYFETMDVKAIEQAASGLYIIYGLKIMGSIAVFSE